MKDENYTYKTTMIRLAMIGIVSTVMFLVSCCSSFSFAPYYKTDEQVDTLKSREDFILEIDQEERVHYGLFPSVSGFKTALFQGQADGGYKVTIITETEELCSINHDPMAVDILCDYIDSFEVRQQPNEEKLRDPWIIKKDSNGRVVYEKLKDVFSEKWEILDYDELMLPITRNEIKQNMRTANTILYSICGECTGYLVGGCIGASIFYEPSPYSAPGGDWEFGTYKPGCFFIWAVGMIVGPIIGYTYGHSKDVHKAISQIKIMRRPQVKPIDLDGKRRGIRLI